MEKVAEIMEQIAKMKTAEQEEIYNRLGDLLRGNEIYRIPDGHEVIR